MQWKAPQRTIKDYRSYIDSYFQKFESLTFPNFEAFLNGIPAKHNETRVKAYKAILSYANYLDLHGLIDADFLPKASNKRFRPKSKGPKKQDSITQDEFERMLAACDTLGERFLLSLLWYTGLRASEACALKREDIIYKEKYLTTKGWRLEIVKKLEGVAGFHVPAHCRIVERTFG